MQKPFVIERSSSPLALPIKICTDVLHKIKLRAWLKLVEQSQLFDKDWYLQQYPDVAQSGVDPLIHFLMSGAKEGRDPSPLFDTQWYLEHYPRVTKSGINPLIHYLKSNGKQICDPNPLFDTDWYIEKYPEATATISPLTHYLLNGQNNDPSPFFSTKAYIEQCPQLIKFGVNPLAHYYSRGSTWFKNLPAEISNIDPVTLIRSVLAAPTKNKKILFVGHDASATGAPVLLLNVIRSLKESFVIEPSVILLTGGPLENDFKNLAPTHIVDNEYKTNKNYKRFKELALALRTDDYTAALCNTAVTGECAKILYQLGFLVVSTIHEMQSVIKAVKVEEECRTIVDYAHKVIFPAERVRADFEELAGSLNNRASINPQGLLKLPQIIDNAKEKVCARLGIPSNSYLILGAGRGDLRKGFDLYLQLARHLSSQDKRFQFIWIGNIAHDMEVWFKHDMDIALLKQCFHHIPFTDEIPVYYQAADVFVLPSREDPFPSVVIDALSYGTPVIAFDKCGGYGDVLATKQNGMLVPYGDLSSMAMAIQNIISDKVMHTAEAKQARTESIVRQFDFGRYVADILQLFDNAVQFK